VTDATDVIDAGAPSAFAAGSPVRRWLPWVLLAVVVVTCLSVAAFGSREAPTAQDRVSNVSRTIKCPTCSGESVAESNAVASQEIRADIARRIQAGESDDEIRTYYVSRWGQAILLTPSASGINALVWLLPVVALAMAIGFLVIVFRRWGREVPAHASAADEALVAEALQREREQDAADADPHGEGSSR
jgi:cytochrome c-type biogenesis protein CcmH